MPSPKGGGANAIQNGQKLELAIDQLILSKGLCLKEREKIGNVPLEATYYSQIKVVYNLPFLGITFTMIHDHYTEWVDRFGKRVSVPIELKEQKTSGSVSDKLDNYALRIRDGILPFVILCANEASTEWFKTKLTYYEGTGLRGFLYFTRHSMGRLIDTLEFCRLHKLSTDETLEQLYATRDNITALVGLRNNKYLPDKVHEIWLRSYFQLSEEQYQLLLRLKRQPKCTGESYEQCFRRLVGLPPLDVSVTLAPSSSSISSVSPIPSF